LVDLLETVGRQRPAVRALEVLDHPGLARRIDEVDVARLLVLLQARDQAEPLVHLLDEGAIGVGDLRAHLADDRIGVLALAHRRSVVEFSLHSDRWPSTARPSCSSSWPGERPRPKPITWSNGCRRPAPTPV